MTEILLAFTFATFFLALSPGPDNIFVLTLSVTHGFRYGLATIAGLMTGCFVHATYMAFGISALLIQWPVLLYGIQFFGAAYLLYLAYQVFRSPAEIGETSVDAQAPSLIAMYKKGFLMNVLNPKVSLFFIAFFPGFLFEPSWPFWLQIYTLTALFIVVSSTVFGSIALAGGVFTQALKRPGVGQVMKWVQILVFVGIAVYLMVVEPTIPELG